MRLLHIMLPIVFGLDQSWAYNFP